MSDAAAQLLTWRFDAIRTLADVPRYWAARQPAKVALIDGPRRHSYHELDHQSERLANRLVALGIPSGANVGYLGKNTAEFYAVWFGASKARCALAPFNWRCTVDELVGPVGDAAPPILFVTRDFVEAIEAVRSRAGLTFEVVELDPIDGFETWLGDTPATLCAREVAASDVALLSYTSGTTGAPKGVMATQEAFAYSFLCGALEPDMAYRDGDVMLMSMPNFHLGGSWVSVAALYHGHALSIIPAFDPQACLEVIVRDQVTIAPLVPAAIQLLLDQPGVGPGTFGALRLVMYFGSPISIGLMQRAVDEMGCALAQFYGTTESYFLTILRHADHVDDGSGRLTSCGRPLPLVGIRVDGGQGGDAATGAIGEIVVRTPMMMAGYRNRPDATAEALHHGWYRTGDLGRLDEAGYLFIVDRAKDMVITGGENVYSTEVEQALFRLPGVQGCAVIGLPDPKWGERVVAAIVADPAAGLSADTVVAHCKGLIAGYKVPKQVIFVEALPTTPTGKVRKVELRRQLAEASA